MRWILLEKFRSASLRKRLWLGAGAVAVFIGTLMAAQSFVPSPQPADEVFPGLRLRCDFIAFYTGGAFVREGRYRDLFNIPMVHAFEVQTCRDHGVEIGAAVGPWWNPPFYAWVFAPLSALPYPRAIQTWVAINLLCASIACAVMCHWLARGKPTRDEPRPVAHTWRTWLLVPAIVVLATPFIQALSHGQNTCTSLVLLTATVALWRNGRAILAGMIGGLMFYKPQLGAVLGSMLLLTLGWRAAAGLALTGMALLAATLAMPGTLGEFLHQMPKNIHTVQCDFPYMWDRHVTFKAFWRLLFQGFAPGEPLPTVTALASLCSAVVGIALFRAWWQAGAAWRRFRHEISPSVSSEAGVSVRQRSARSGVTVGPMTLTQSRSRDRLISATIAATPLLMPFYFDYDQLLLAIPAVLFAAEHSRRDRAMPLPGVDRWLLRLWPVQYLWMMFNADVATATHLNVGVLLLSGVAGLLIVRAGRQERANELAGPLSGETGLTPAALASAQHGSTLAAA